MLRRLMMAARSSSHSGLAEEIMADSPWAYYQLGESPGATAYADSSGNGRHLATLGAGLSPGQPAIAPPGTSVGLNGTSAYISSAAGQYGTSAQTAFDGLSFSAVCCARLAAYPASGLNAGVFHIGDWGVNESQGVFIYINQTGGVRAMFRVGMDWQTLSSTESVIQLGTDYIIHARRAADGAAELFVNGSVVASGISPGPLRMKVAAGSVIEMGALSANSNFINGQLQHFAIFAGVLSDARISAQIAAAGL